MSHDRRAVQVKEEHEDDTTEVTMPQSDLAQRLTSSCVSSAASLVTMKYDESEHHPLSVLNPANCRQPLSYNCIKRDYSNDINSVLCKKRVNKSEECHCDECEGRVFVEGEDQEDGGELLLTETEDEKDELQRWVRVVDPGTPELPLEEEDEDSNAEQSAHLDEISSSEITKTAVYDDKNEEDGKDDNAAAESTRKRPILPEVHKSTPNPKRAKPTSTSYRCTVSGCSRVFQSQSGYYQHKVVHSGKYTCLQCGKSCKSTTALQQHQMKHSGEKPYQCTQCDKSFAHSSNLTVHLRVHTGDRPYKCTHCSYASAHKSHLTTHLRLHTDQLPFQCEQCMKRFNEKQQLTSHVRNKH